MLSLRTSARAEIGIQIVPLTAFGSNRPSPRRRPPLRGPDGTREPQTTAGHAGHRHHSRDRGPEDKGTLLGTWALASIRFWASAYSHFTAVTVAVKGVPRAHSIRIGVRLPQNANKRRRHPEAEKQPWHRAGNAGRSRPGAVGSFTPVGPRGHLPLHTFCQLLCVSGLQVPHHMNLAYQLPSQH